MSQKPEGHPTSSLADRISQAAEQGQRVFSDIGRTIGRTYLSASELLTDAELRRKGRILLVHEASKGIKEIQHRVGSAAGNIGRSLQQGAGTIQQRIAEGPRHIQGALERIKQRVNEARLANLVEGYNNLSVDVQVGPKLYEDAPQEIRSRLWAAITMNPSFTPITIQMPSNRSVDDSELIGLDDDEIDGDWSLVDSPIESHRNKNRTGGDSSLMDLENILSAMSNVQWPLEESIDEDSNYKTLIQITIGQDEIDEIIRRDIHRTFPELPHFNFPEKRESLFKILKAYSLHDLEVGYCQGMGFVAGILLLYLPEEWAFKTLCLLMNENQVNLRRLYVPGLEPLKMELFKLEWLLEKHLPILNAHLKENNVTPLLYASQWFLTCFSCPFTEVFAARVLDFMLLERSCAPLVRTAFAVLVHLGEDLLQLDSFEEILTHIKVKPLSWDYRKVREVLSSSLKSPITDEEIKIADGQYLPSRSNSVATIEPDLIDLEDREVSTDEGGERSLDLILSMDMLLDVEIPDDDPFNAVKQKME